jgi:perosamine synthetase
MSEEFIPLSDPDITQSELDTVNAALCRPHLGQGALVGAFEQAYAARVNRPHAVAVSGSTLALWLCLQAYKIGSGDEILVSPHSWHQIARAVSIAGAAPVFCDIDYWSGTLSANSAAARITPKTRAIVAGNTNGHPADWAALRALAGQHRLVLIEDSTEAIGSVYQGKPVGSFGDCAIFDFSQASPLCCGEGAMIVTGDLDLARRLRYLRDRRPDERFSVSITSFLPVNARMSDITAALGLAQLKRLDEMLASRRQIIRWYEDEIKSFEGIKPPYVAPGVTEASWFLYTVHLGTRFSLGSCRAIVEDLHTAGIEAELYSRPLYLERYYTDRGAQKGICFVAEKVADRAIALPLHAHLTQEEIKFIVKTAKDASVNVGAGAAIYL